MSDLRDLLEVQELDLAADALRIAKASMPERQERVACASRLRLLDESAGELEARRVALAEDERRAAAEVAELSAKAERCEKRLYSGEVTAAGELVDLQEELRLHKAQRAKFEEAQLELMEAIEAVDAELAERAAGEAREQATLRDLDAAIRAFEEKSDAEVTELGTKRNAVAARGLPEAVLAAYHKLREKPRLAGRGAAAFEGGACRGCRVSLPVMEATRIRSAPKDSLEFCPHCHRVLVR